VTAIRNKGPEHARMFWNILEQLGDCGGSFNILEMSKLLGNTFPRRRRKNNHFNKRNAFLKSFPGVKYVKTTVWKYSKVWAESDEATRELFTDLGKTENAYFEHFLAALDNPHLLPSASSDESDSQPSDSKSNHEDQGTTSKSLPAHDVPSYFQALDKGRDGLLARWVVCAPSSQGP